MRVNVWLYASIGLANASALFPRDVQNAAVKQAEPGEEEEGDMSPTGWKPKSSSPQFFSLKVDDECTGDELADSCQLAGYGIRLQDGIVIATPYNKWWQSKLPVFFVDDDTQAYTVSHFTLAKL